MKSFLFGIFATLTLTSSAQTYINFHYPNDGTNFSIPSNTLCQIVDAQGPITGYWSSITYPSSTNSIFINPFSAYQPQANRFILGPATLSFPDYGSGEYYVLLSLTSVNVSPVINGYAVQPNNQPATVALETSTNLSTWTATTNGNYDATGSARFFRLKMTYP